MDDHTQEDELTVDSRVVDPILTISGSIEEGASTAPKGQAPEHWFDVPMKITTKVSMRIGTNQLALGSATLAGVAAGLHRAFGRELRVEAAIRRAALGIANDPYLPESHGGDLPPELMSVRYDVRSLIEDQPIDIISGLPVDDGFAVPDHGSDAHIDPDDKPF